jgi:V-type H+-transporting ATPase subunit d
MSYWNDVIPLDGSILSQLYVLLQPLRNYMILCLSKLHWVLISSYHCYLLTLAPYFKECLSAAELDELNIEIIRNTLYKAYLEDFMSFCSKLPSPTDTIMQEILSFEADRRAINITVNSFGTDLSKDTRAKLYPNMGYLYPNGTLALQQAEDIEGVKMACDSVIEYRSFFEQTSSGGGGGFQKSLEDHFFEREAQLNKLAFLQQV